MKKPISEVMTPNPYTANPKMQLEEVITLLAKHRMKWLE
jgi:CBS domain-containing protein